MFTLRSNAIRANTTIPIQLIVAAVLYPLPIDTNTSYLQVSSCNTGLDVRLNPCTYMLSTAAVSFVECRNGYKYVYAEHRWYVKMS